MENYYYKQPRYYDKFKCIGGECPETCCERWVIEWTKEEIEKLNSADAPETLKKKMEGLFFKNDSGKYIMNLPNGGLCPMNDKCTGLCMIQKELGEAYLSQVCAIYPRNFLVHKNIIIRHCSQSCSAMIDLLAADENATVLELVRVRDLDKLKKYRMITDSKDTIKKFPFLEYRLNILDFYCEILHKKSHSIETSLIIGAIASKHLSQAIENHKYSEIPKLIEDLRSQVNSKSVARSVNDIVPNYQLKFKVINNLIVSIFSYHSSRFDMSALHDGKELIVENYIKGIDNFNKAVNDKRYLIKNIIINLFYDMRMPFYIIENTLFENYSYFVLCSAVIKIVAASIGLKNDNIYEGFRSAIAELSRGLSHSMPRAQSSINELKSLGFTSPAHLALIIK